MLMTITKSRIIVYYRAREIRLVITLLSLRPDAISRLPQFHIGILAEMFDISCDQLSQLPRFANLDPVVDRPEEAVALRLKRAALRIDELKDQHRRIVDPLPQ